MTQDATGKVESGLRLIWRVTVLQFKVPMLGVFWPIVAPVAWHLWVSLEEMLAVGLAYGMWRFDVLRLAPTPDGSLEQLLAEIGLGLAFAIATAGIFALVGLAYGQATVRHIGLANRSSRWMPARHQVPRYMVASALKNFLILWGFLAFLIPGIYLTARLMYVQHALIDKDLGVWEAIQESWRLSERAGRGLVGLVGWLLVIGIFCAMVTTVALIDTLVAGLVAELVVLAVVGSDYVMAQAVTYAELQEAPSEAVEAASETTT